MASACELDSTFVTGAFTLVGALFGALATLLGARWTARHQHTLVQVSQFRAAFVDALIKLERGDDDVYEVLTDEVIAAHERAKIQLEPWVDASVRRRLGDAWRAYKESASTRAPGNLNNRPGECRAALERIHALLAAGAGEA